MHQNSEETFANRPILPLKFDFNGSPPAVYDMLPPM